MILFPLNSKSSLAGHCFGIRDVSLSEKMQMEPRFDLEKAINYVCHSEAVKKQQVTL